MSKKEEFKNFISKNPSLINKVNNGTTTWQKLFEIYDLYGEKSEVWNKYLRKETSDRSASNNTTLGIKDVLNNIKNMNIENVQKNVSSLQKAVEFLTDITAGSSVKKGSPKTFAQRPINKFFDD